MLIKSVLIFFYIKVYNIYLVLISMNTSKIDDKVIFKKINVSIIK